MDGDTDCFFFFKQKTAYEMRISDWSSDVCSSDLITMQQDTPDASGPTTHFGYKTVAEAEKAGKVAEVFHSVAARYDIMNDLMSVGLHRAWKAFTIARANVVAGMKVLDIAGGTGDLAKAFARRAGPDGEVWLTDSSEEPPSELQSLMRISYA